MSLLTIPNLPCPPSLNNAYTTGRGHGKRVLTSEGRAFKAQAALLVRNAAALAGFTVPDKQPIRLTFWFYFANVQRDGSNAVKLIEDAVAEALGFNDSRVVAMTWHKAIDKAAPRCTVAVKVGDVPLEEAQQ